MGYRALLVRKLKVPSKDEGGLLAEGECVQDGNLFGYGDLIIIGCSGIPFSIAESAKAEGNSDEIYRPGVEDAQGKEFYEIETTASRVHFLNVSSQSRSS